VSGASDFLASELADHVMGMGTRDYTPPSSISLRLYRSPPADDGTGGVEATYPGYAPVLTTAATWRDATSTGVVSNDLSVSFPQALGPEGAPLTHVGYFDPLANQLFVAPLLDMTQEPIGGETPEFNPGDLQLDWNANTAGLSHYLGQALGDHVMGMGTKNFSPPPAIYADGYVAEPDDADSGGTRASHGGYAAVLTTPATWSVGAAGLITSLEDLIWPKATSAEGNDWTALVLRDATGGTGNLLLHGPWPGPTIEPLQDSRGILRAGRLQLDWNNN